VGAVLGYLVVINLVLVAFNLLPAFPLDGGRVLRAALWRWKGDLRWATRIASEVGSGFGTALMVLAVLHLLAGSLVGAIWWFVLGLFVRAAARMSYQQLVWRQLLTETTVGSLMNAEPRTVSPDVPIDQFVDDYVYRYHHKMFPVVRDSRLLGCITTAEIKGLPREQWHEHTVGELANPCTEDSVVSRDADAVVALRTMRRTGQSRLVVADNGRPIGVIALKDLWTYISERVELEGDEFATA
jgi:CBS domain-containing protein